MREAHFARFDPQTACGSLTLGCSRSAYLGSWHPIFDYNR
jgi:hypothetical protein